MANIDAARARAPRGTRPVMQAFFTALDAIPEGRRGDVAKAAQIAIRDELKDLQVKAKLAAKTVRAAKAPRATKRTAAKPVAVKAKAKTGRGRATAGAAPAVKRSNGRRAEHVAAA